MISASAEPARHSYEFVLAWVAAAYFLDTMSLLWCQVSLLPKQESLRSALLAGLLDRIALDSVDIYRPILLDQTFTNTQKYGKEILLLHTG